jgi:peptidoglycan/xylan/chitin deacetylase (PgdA/CDA1 family)
MDSVKNKYYFGTFSEFPKLMKIKKIILLRHDVDISLDCALKLAKLEHEHGLKATYFILLHSEYYNALSESNQIKIKEISDLGHEIGLHYDTNFLSKNNKNAILQIKQESEILSNLIGKKIKSIAQHNTSISSSLNIESNPDFIDPRSVDILQKIMYISDSGHYWREGCMCKHINKHEKLQILTHPIWWNDDSRTIEKSFEQFKNDQIKKIDNDISNHKNMLKNYLNMLKNHNKT